MILKLTTAVTKVLSIKIRTWGVGWCVCVVCVWGWGGVGVGEYGTSKMIGDSFYLLDLQSWGNGTLGRICEIFRSEYLIHR